MSGTARRGTATDEEKREARELDVELADGVSSEALSRHVLVRRQCLDPPPSWLREVAMHMGLGDEHSSESVLFNLIEADLMTRGRELELLVWFLYGVSRHLAAGAWDGPNGSGIATVTMEKLARRLAAEPWVLSSLRRYLPGTVYRIGPFCGRTDTLAYKAAARLLGEELGLGQNSVPSRRSSKG